MSASNFVRLLVEPLVKDLDAVQVESRDDNPTLFLSVADSDRGAVIGRRGRTLRALRELLSAHGTRHDHNAELELVDDDSGESDGQEAQDNDS